MGGAACLAWGMGSLDSSLFALGGPMMWPLAALAVIGTLCFVDRLIHLHRGQIRMDSFLAGIKNLVRKGRVVEALTHCEETPGPVAAVVRAGLLSLRRDEAQLRVALEEAARLEIPALEKRVGTVLAVARTAPLLGLLGTVLGFFQTFRGLAAEGAYAHFGVLNAGLGAALVSTAAGLAFGVVFGLGYHFLHGRVRSLVRDMEAAAYDLVQFRLEEGEGWADAAPVASATQEEDNGATA